MLSGDLKKPRVCKAGLFDEILLLISLDVWDWSKSSSKSSLAGRASGESKEIVESSKAIWLSSGILEIVLSEDLKISGRSLKSIALAVFGFWDSAAARKY